MCLRLPHISSWSRGRGTVAKAEAGGRGSAVNVQPASVLLVVRLAFSHSSAGAPSPLYGNLLSYTGSKISLKPKKYLISREKYENFYVVNDFFYGDRIRFVLFTRQHTQQTRRLQRHILHSIDSDGNKIQTNSVHQSCRARNRLRRHTPGGRLVCVQCIVSLE